MNWEFYPDLYMLLIKDEFSNYKDIYEFMSIKSKTERFSTINCIYFSAKHF